MSVRELKKRAGQAVNGSLFAHMCMIFADGSHETVRTQEALCNDYIYYSPRTLTAIVMSAPDRLMPTLMKLGNRWKHLIALLCVLKKLTAASVATLRKTQDQSTPQ